jgi:hypothetical protein
MVLVVARSVIVKAPTTDKIRFHDTLVLFFVLPSFFMRPARKLFSCVQSE